jgi:hypothetical protein
MKQQTYADINERASCAGEVWFNGGLLTVEYKHRLFDILCVNDHKCLASLVMVPCDMVNIKAKPSLPHKKNRKCTKWRLNYVKREVSHPHE